MTGNMTSPGKYCEASTAPAEMLRMPVWNVIVICVLRSRFHRREMPRPQKYPVLANRPMNTITPTSCGVRFLMYGETPVELDRITRTSAIFAAGARTGDSSALPQPWLRSLTTMPARAGSAIWTSMLCIIETASTWTVWPSKSCRVSGMVTGASTVETRSVARPCDRSPSNMLIHIAETTATGTLYSSTIPQTMLRLSPKKRRPRP